MSHRNDFPASPIAARATRSHAHVRDPEAAPANGAEQAHRELARAKASDSLSADDIDEQS